MSFQSFCQGFLERVQQSLNVKTVYGEPITAEGRTIIPVAKIAFGFGGGSGCKQGGEQPQEGEGGGGCGRASPVGVVEIDKESTRFIPIGVGKQLAVAAVLGFLLGRWMTRRR